MRILKEQRPAIATSFAGLFAFSGEGQNWEKVMTFTRTGDTLKRGRGGGHLYLQALRLIGGSAMKPIIAASLLALRPDRLRRPERGRCTDARQDPRIGVRAGAAGYPAQRNPEPPPAPPAPEQPVLNELDNAVMENEVELDPLAPTAEGAIPAAFQDRWGQRPADCRPGDTIGGGWSSAATA